MYIHMIVCMYVDEHVPTVQYHILSLTLSLSLLLLSLSLSLSLPLSLPPQPVQSHTDTPQHIQSHAERFVYVRMLKSQCTLPATSGYEKREGSEAQEA